ncbi:tRNA-guanine transglycosylase DpdA [Duganella fentianensis]|uniref:tRNA-guanine transglycosylase DpdA n=1 Tax=Duganella fentianensis TaxID=2692177 RepID=UPI0032B22FA1
MKFLYSDTQDYVDPDYDFAADRNAPNRRRYWDDVYAHELMSPTPYDGLLVAMSAVRSAPGVATSKVRYSTSEEQRLLRDGVRRFLRFDGPKYKDAMMMGDCGSFAYVDQEKPAYSPEEVYEFYADGCFTHGVSPDHIIFACDTTNPPREAMGEDIHYRYDLTLENAREFMRICESEGFPFEPMGAVQGWSPLSIAQAAVEMEKMGYRYLAIGGLVPLKVDVIHQVLKTLRLHIRPETKIHLLGFAKADSIQDFTNYGITSFDSTSPLIRAFMDEKANYYMPNGQAGLDYYAAIRIPQATENPRLMQGIKRGIFNPEDLQRREERALTALRQFDQGKQSMDAAVEAIMDYQHFATISGDQQKIAKTLAKVRQRLEHTLTDAPWKRCNCDVCAKVGVEVIIFRSANRNRRRGFHNLGIYHQHVQRILEKSR